MTDTTATVPADAAVPLPIRYLDCLLVVAVLPVAIIAGGPVLGLLVGAAAWIFQRLLGNVIEARAAAATNARQATAITFTGVMGRPILLGITILAVGLLGERRDGLAAALLVLGAFTVHLILSIVLRPRAQSQRNSAT